MKDVERETWFLNPGDEVVAVRPLDTVGANVMTGMVGVVFEEGDGLHGPLVRWEHGGVCNVYPGDVDSMPALNGLRPSLLTVVRAFVGSDPDLRGSGCSCCNAKRQVLQELELKMPWVLAIQYGNVEVSDSELQPDACRRLVDGKLVSEEKLK